MASNFKIQANGTNNILFLDLIGDFDGSSAFELLNVLQEKLNSPDHRAYINTSRLKSIHPFGVDVFARNLTSITHNNNIVFTGTYAPEISPSEKLRFGWREDTVKGNSFIDRLGAPGSHGTISVSQGGEQ